MSKPRYLRQTTTGACFAYSDAKAKRFDMEPWTGPLPWEEKEEEAAPKEEAKKVVVVPEATPAPPRPQEGQPEPHGEGEPEQEQEQEPAAAVAPPRPEPHLTRGEKIKNAVFLIKPGDYAKAAFGRPRMPKIADVEEIAGLDDVTVEEVLAALPVR